MREDPNIWTDIDNGVYSLVLASPEILLPHSSHFWFDTIRNRTTNAFCRRLVCIAVDEAHLLWGWREFRKEYSNAGKLRVYFPAVPIMALSATISPNVLEYTHRTLTLRSPVFLYKRSLDRPNITYMVQKIEQKGYGKLDILIPKEGGVGDISKTMLFVNNIDESITIAAHLQNRLPESMWPTAKQIISAFSSDLEADTKKALMENFALGNTRIWVCTDAAGMGIDIEDVERAIQWKIRDHVNLAVLLQKIGCAGRNRNIPAVSIVFVENKHILPRDVANIPNSLFRDFQVAIRPKDGARASELIGQLYLESGFVHKKKKSISLFHDIDPALLWFINTTGCRRCLALACFMSNALAAKCACSLVCCDNCMYNQHINERGLGKISAFQRHDITAKHCYCYLSTNKYQIRCRSMAQLKQNQQPQMDLDIQEACRAAFSKFAALTWPDEVDKYIFPESLREKVATAGARGNIVSIQTLHEVLHPACILEKSWLGIHANTLVKMISSFFAQQSTPAQQQEASWAKGKKTRGRGRLKRSSARQNN